MGRSGVAALVATIFIGGALGTASVVALVSNQTGAPSKSPTNIEQPEIQYGQG